METTLDKSDVCWLAAAIVMVAAACLAGCNTATPASRANSVKVGDITITFEEKSHDCRVTFGDGLMASADGQGDQQANPVQTNDVKPDVDITVPTTATKTTTKAAASSLSDTAKEVAEKVKDAVSGKKDDTDTDTKDDTATEAGDDADGPAESVFDDVKEATAATYKE